MARFARIATAALASAAIAGCSFFSKPPPPPPPPPAAPQVIPPPQIVMPPPVEKPAPPAPVAFSIDAAPNVNPDASGRPSPVVVRVYELKSPVSFEASDFFTLFDRESQAIGADLIGRDEYQLKPGEQVLLARPLRPGTRALGVAVAFRDLDRSRWRATLALPNAPPNGLSVRIDSRAVTVNIK